MIPTNEILSKTTVPKEKHKVTVVQRGKEIL